MARQGAGHSPPFHSLHCMTSLIIILDLNASWIIPQFQGFSMMHVCLVTISIILFLQENILSWSDNSPVGFQLWNSDVLGNISLTKVVSRYGRIINHLDFTRIIQMANKTLYPRPSPVDRIRNTSCTLMVWKPRLFWTQVSCENKIAKEWVCKMRRYMNASDIQKNTIKEICKKHSGITYRLLVIRSIRCLYIKMQG